MKKNNFKNLLLSLIIGIITIAAGSVFALTFEHAAIATAPEPEMPIATTTQGIAVSSTTPVVPVSNAAYPQRLVIPAINVDSHVTDVGISIHGTMAVPVKFTDVGWYRYGPKPGEAGSAVIAGHLDNGLSLAGPFKHLSDLKSGDDIYVTDAAGKQTHFKVVSSDTLDYNTTATENVFKDTSSVPELKLITCEGTWDQSHKTYSNRLVVTAQLVSE